MKRKGFLVCCTSFAEGPHRAIAGSTLVLPEHPAAVAFPEHFRVADPYDRRTRAEHRRLLLSAQARLAATSAPFGLWGVR